MQQSSEQKQKNTNNRGGFYMFKKMKHMKNEKGLTLIELLAVIVILAIIAAIAIPAIGNIINNSEIKATKADALNILNAANIYMTDNPTVTKIEVEKSAASAKSYSGSTEITTIDSFINSVQSTGSFEDIAYTISKDTAGKLSIKSTTPIVAGGKKISFVDAGITNINAKDASDDGAFVKVDKDN